MKELRVYKTPQLFLDDCLLYLEKREIENNLPIGIVNGIENKTAEYPNYVFISIKDNNEVLAVSIKLIHKIVVSAPADNNEIIKLLACYYLNNRIIGSSVVSESKQAEMFAKDYHLGKTSKRELMVHELTKVENQPLPHGKFAAAGNEHLDLLVKWTIEFEMESQGKLQRTAEQTRAVIQKRIEAKNSFVWVCNNRTVSMAAINRMTRNIGIVGLVYTPTENRGNGFATACVSELSKEILRQGFSKCGLFTDKANPTSNRIYARIGYKPVTKYSDIGFI